jgi:hemerythrin
MDWKPEYSVGIDEIDAQHRQILAHMTQVHQAIAAGDRWHVIHFLLVALDDLMKLHFAVEESLLQIIGYPESCEHRQSHGRIAANLADLQRRGLNENISDELSAFLKEWFLMHVRESDQAYARFARERFPGLLAPA